MPFEIQTQQQTLWCWAAVAASIDAYFAPGAAKEQSEVATAVLNHPTNCTPDEPSCNRVARLQDALGKVGRLRQSLTDPLEWDKLKLQIDQRLPVCARIQWLGGGGHFVVISGYSVTPSGRRMVIIKDPWYVDSVLAFEDFSSDYLLSGGTWSDSYLVKPS